MYFSVGCGLQTACPFKAEGVYLIPTMRVSPGVAPVTDIVISPVVELYEFEEERFPQLASYTFTCPRLWGGIGSQGELLVHPDIEILLWSMVIVKDAEGAMIWE